MFCARLLAFAGGMNGGVGGVLVGVSACLVGRRVRYDGSARPSAPLLEFLRHVVRLEPVCPEMDIGLGVPRPPIHLTARGGEIRVLGVDDPLRDHTEALRASAKRFLRRHPGLRGLIVKSRSPSCALDDAPVEGLPSPAAGMFVQTVLRRRPGLAVVDERGLESDETLMRFLLLVLDPANAPRCSADREAMAFALKRLTESGEGVLGSTGRRRLRCWLEAHT